MNSINDDGRIYRTQTCVAGGLAIHVQTDQFEMTEADAEMAFDAIVDMARKGL